MNCISKMKPDPKLEMIGHNVVIDNGTYTVKGGFSDTDTPQCSLPCLVGHGRHKGAMSSLGLKETYVGGAAQKLRGILDISHPIRQGSVQNWDDLEVLWSYILETELKTEGGAQPVIMTQPPLASQQEEDTMAEILVEKLGVPAFFLADKSVMSLYGGGQMTGIAVDSGHDTTYIVPSYQVGKKFVLYCICNILCPAARWAKSLYYIVFVIYCAQLPGGQRVCIILYL